MSALPPAAGEIPENGRILQPVIWNVITIWFQQDDHPESWADATALLPPFDSQWASLVATLQLINATIWQLEKEGQDPFADATRLAKIYRDREEAVRLRQQTVAEWDQLIHDRLQAAGQLREDAVLHCETPGQLLDRITRLALDVHHCKQELTDLRQQPGADSDLTAPYERLRAVSSHLVDLTGCMDTLLADLRSGRGTFNLYSY
jgi:hypothetical protein